VAWLLDVVPPDYRLHGVLRRHPVALAALAGHHLTACVAGAREGYRTARAELGNQLPPGSLDAVLEAYRTEGRRLVETAHAVDLVTRALRGEVFTPQLAGTQDEGRGASGRRGPTQRGTKERAANSSEVRAKQAAPPSDVSPAKQAGTPSRATAKQADTTSELPTKRAATSSEAPAKRADAPSDATAKRATTANETASAKRATTANETTSAKRAGRARETKSAKRSVDSPGATPAKQR
jgi:hypothetical protein